MRVLKQFLFIALAFAAFSVTAMAQRPDDRNRPPKDPPTIPAPDKDKPRPPKDNGNSNRPQKPNQELFFEEQKTTA